MASSSSQPDVAPLPVRVRPSFLAPVGDLYSRFSKWRTSLGLPNPGTVENLQKEVKMTHLTNYLFDGARADITKTLSASPAFQVTHSFSMASQTAPPAYNFGAVFGSTRLFMQGSVDHEGSLSARFNYGWTPTNVSKFQIQLAQGMNLFQGEQDFQGQDYSANVKVLNPSPLEGTGIYVGNYLQSVTPNLALGAETLFQNLSPDNRSLNTSYLLKYTSTEKDWIASAQIQPQGVIQATYWQKLSEKVEVAADLQVIASPAKRDGVATVGAKYDFRMSTVRAQIDSSGKVAALLEQRLAPTFAFTVGGEIDHFRNTAKVGVGVMIESSTLTPEEMGMPPGSGSFP